MGEASTQPEASIQSGTAPYYAPRTCSALWQKHLEVHPWLAAGRGARLWSRGGSRGAGVRGRRGALVHALLQRCSDQIQVSVLGQEPEGVKVLG